jgi:hypothetical protein
VGRRQAHRAKIFAMYLVGDYVWTASQDNKVRRWTHAAVYFDELVLQMAYVEHCDLERVICFAVEVLSLKQSAYYELCFILLSILFTHQF